MYSKAQVLVVLEKLDRLRISLDHLQETGIGKTVNRYRKCSDPVGMKAKSIVNKWKGLVQAAMAEDQSQRSDNSPMQTDGESEHMSHSNATDDDISTYDSFENSSPVIHKKEERSSNRGRSSETEAYSSKVKRKFESSRDEKPSKKPCDNSGGSEQHAGDRSVKTDSRDMVHQLKESLPCNGLSKDRKCSDISNKAASYQSQLNSSGNRDSSKGSSHSSSHKGHKSESHKSGSSSHSNRDVLHKHRSSQKDGKNSASVSGYDSACKSANIVSDSEVLPQNGTTVEAAQSAEQNQESRNVSGKNPRNLDLANNLKRKTHDSSYSDMPQKKQLLESEATAIITDLHDGSTSDYGRSALAKQSGHRDHSSHKDSSSKTNSSSHKDSTFPKEESLAHFSKEKCTSVSKSSPDKSTSMNREASSSSKESLSGRHQSHRESASKNSSQRESSAKASSHKELSSKHVSHKDSASKTSSVKESSSKHSSQKQSSSVPPVFKESPRKVSNEKPTSLEESFSESFPDDAITKSSSLGKLAGSSVRDRLKAVDGPSKAERGLSESRSKIAAAAFSALNSDEEADSCDMSFEEMLNYDIALSKTGAATKPAPSKTAADMNEVLKKDDGRIAKGYSGSQSSVLSDSNKPINERDSVGRKVSQNAESSSKKNDRSSKSEDSSMVSRKDGSKANSSHHYKLDGNSSTQQDKSSSSHSKSEGSSSKEHTKSSVTVQKLENSGKQEFSKSSSSKNKSEGHSSKEHSKSSSNPNKSVSSNSKEHSVSSSSHSKSESRSSKELSKSSSSYQQKLESSTIKEPSKSGSSSHRPESSKKQSGDDSKDKNSQLVEQRKETKELGHKSGKAAAEKFVSFANDSDADSEDLDNNGKSFEDFLNYKASVSKNKSTAKSSKLYVAGSNDKIERKLLDSNTDCGDGFSLSHPLVNVPLPKQEELNLGLDGDGLPLYPSMRQELQVKKDNVEKLVNLERRYGQKMIYSGKRQATVPTAMTSLFAACMQVLQENIDDITYVGGIPADILKPVLELCSVSQLERLEFYNPQFVGDTEDLWKVHCNRDFRGRDPEELESWREMYLRLQDARNKRLATISQSVMANKKRAEKEVPRIQLTYVDHSLCTGRRTSKKLAAVRNAATAIVSDETSQPRSKQEILDSLKNQVSKPMIRRRGGGYRPEITSVSKPAAPLMQKTLKFLKGMKR